MKIKILPSLFAADIGKLAEEARRAEAAGADALHLDIMDGHFVPNLSMGPNVVEMAKRTVSIPLNVHLMLTRPDQYAKRFVEAGADSLLIHVEAQCNVMELLDRIRDWGIKPGITLSPDTPAEMTFSTIDKVDEVLIMSVYPGYGGQKFMPEVLPKIRAIRDHAKMKGFTDLDILVDGGMDMETAPLCAAQGANAIIAGTSLFTVPDMKTHLEALRTKTAEAFA